MATDIFFQIRREQMHALARSGEEDFQMRMIGYLRDLFSVKTSEFSDQQLIRLIERSTKDAGKYGIVSEKDVSRYIALICTFGLEFETKPEFDWAAAILDPESGRLPGFRIDDVFEEAIERLSETPELETKSIEIPNE